MDFLNWNFLGGEKRLKDFQFMLCAAVEQAADVQGIRLQRHFR